MPKKSASYDDFLSQQLREDPELAMAYLNEAYESKDPHALFVAIRNVINAHDGMTQMEQDTGIKRQSLYKMLSNEGNPGWISMCTVLDKLGFSIEFKINRKTGKTRAKKSKTAQPQKAVVKKRTAQKPSVAKKRG